MLFREQAVDPVDQFGVDPRDDLVGLDRNGDVMDEIDQHPQADDREQHPDGHRQVGDEDDLFGTADGAQDEQAIHEGGDERAEHHLVGACRA